MSRPTDADWSWYRSELVQLPSGGWVATLPMSCPRCGLPWSDDGRILIRGQADWNWAAPPGGISTSSYECAECGHRAYDER